MRIFRLAFAAVVFLGSLARADVTLTYRNGSSPTPAYAGSRDVRIDDGAGSPFDPAVSYFALTYLKADAAPIKQAPLIKCDLTLVPTGATVTKAELLLDITNLSPMAYGLYPLKRAWVDTEANWTRASSTVTWATAGAQGSTDRGPSAGVLNATVGGPHVGLLDVAVAQGWITSPVGNNGLILGDYTQIDSFAAMSSESITVAKRPALRLTYTVGAGAETVVTFRNGDAPTPAYTGCRDTIIANGPDPQTVTYGADTFLRVAGIPLGNQDGTINGNAAALLLFSLEGIPAFAHVKGAALELEVTQASRTEFPIYEVLPAWVESTANWLNFAGSANPWMAPGAVGVSDRGAEVLGSVTASSPGRMRFPLGDAGVARVGDWVHQSRPNHGIILQNYTVQTALVFPSQEALDAGRRPGFTVTYVEGALVLTGALGTLENGVAIPMQVGRVDEAGAGIGGGAPALTVSVSVASGKAEVSAVKASGYGPTVSLLIPDSALATQTFWVRPTGNGAFRLAVAGGDAYDPGTVDLVVGAGADGGASDGGSSVPAGRSLFGYGCSSTGDGSALGILLVLGVLLGTRRRRPRGGLAALLVTGALVSGALLANEAQAGTRSKRVAPEKPNPYLAPAEKLFADFEYEECLAMLDKAGTWARNQPADVVRIGMLEGVAAGELKQDLRATRAFKRALVLDARATLPVKLSPHVQELYNQALAELGHAVTPRPVEVARPTVDTVTAPPPPPPTPPGPRGPRLVLALDSGVDVLGRSVGGDVGVGFGFSDFEFVARFVPGRVLAAGLTIDYAPRIGIFAPVIGVEGTDYFKASAVAGGPLLGVRFYLAGGFSLGAQAALEFNSASAPYRDRALLALLHLQYDLPF